MSLLAIVFTDDSEESTNDKVIAIMEKLRPVIDKELPNVQVYATINETAKKIKQAIDKKPRAEISLKTLKLLQECVQNQPRSLINRERAVCRQLMVDLELDIPEELPILIAEMEAEEA